MTTFNELGVHASVVDSLAGRGITEAFPIQAATIPPALAGNDVCGRAPTGSGKTLAFGIPLLASARKARPRHPRGLVLTPTRELATQIADELRKLSRRTRVSTFFGGTGYGTQLKALQRGVDIAVACPGRLLDLMDRGAISLDDVRLAVVDEADRMADMGFLPEVRKILDRTPEDRQTLLFSATLDGAVDALIRSYQQDPLTFRTDEDKLDGTRVAHSFIHVDRHDKLHQTAALAHQHQSIVTFCRTKRGADRLARRLSDSGVSVAHIHGDRTQRQRDRALAEFKEGRARMLVATDVAARGIHVDDVDCVIHYDLAGDGKDYIHRSGRTGRAGATGTVVSLVSAEEKGKLVKLRSELELSDVEFDPALEAPKQQSSTPGRPRRPQRAPRRNAKATGHRKAPSGASRNQRRRPRKSAASRG